jgi:hypothetical protein
LKSHLLCGLDRDGHDYQSVKPTNVFSIVKKSFLLYKILNIAFACMLRGRTLGSNENTILRKNSRERRSLFDSEIKASPRDEVPSVHAGCFPLPITTHYYYYSRTLHVAALLLLLLLTRQVPVNDERGQGGRRANKTIVIRIGRRVDGWAGTHRGKTVSDRARDGEWVVARFNLMR